MDSNAGVMFRQQTEPRGGAQPEGSDDDRETRANPSLGTKNILTSGEDIFVL